MFSEKLARDESCDFFAEHEFFNEEFNFVHVYLHKNYKHKMHSHQFYEINLIVSGEGRHYLESTNLEAKIGDVFVIPPGVSHGYYSEDMLDIYHILIKKELFSRYAEELSEVEGFDLLFDIEPQIRQSLGRELNLNIGHAELASFQNDLEKMIALKKSGRYIQLNFATMVLICRLCKRISSSASISKENDIVSVMEYIKANLDSKITLETLCERTHMSSATLNRRFRAAVCQSPMAYVLSARIARARTLIEEGELRRTEIAQICGFYDLAHMNKYLQ